METKDIIESGFVKAFIAEYFEYKIYSFYPDKDRLLYVLCSTDLEKQQVTTKQIDVIKSEIQKLGNEELSFAYLLSCKPESISGHNYIEPNKRFDFWLNRFCEEFIDSTNTFTPIIEACKLFETKISDEDFENEFWEMYPASQKPKENCLSFVIQRESELLNEIEYTISEHKENEYWEFDFEEYQKFIDISKPIELLFNVSELLVQLNRLEMFNEFSLPPQPIVKQKPEPNGKLITFKNSETIDKIHSELKGYFPNKEAELLKALQGEQLSELLLFPHNQNKFVEVFRRLKYNGFLLNTDTETKNWICTTFQFVKKGFAEPQPFNESSVWDNLNKGKGEPTKKERICVTEWLPYKSPLQLTRETENEKL